jgi:hypothetical protein
VVYYNHKDLKVSKYIIGKNTWSDVIERLIESVNINFIGFEKVLNDQYNCLLKKSDF